MAREWSGGDSDMLAELLELLAADSSVVALMAAHPIATNGSSADVATNAPEMSDPEGNDPEINDPWIGRKIGPFRLERLIGRGGMGVVYLGRRLTGFEQTVAIKLVARHIRSEPVLNHFLLERDALARLNHRNIACLLDGGVTTEGLPYLVMEYIEGRRLDEVCDDPATNVEQVLRLMMQLCDAITYVHGNLILHRDLKPGNVLVTDNGTVKLLDFGTVKMIDAASALSSEMTQAGMRPMTLRYASPEHIQGKAFSTASDVYSLGMILYRLLAGRLPDELENLPTGEYLDRLEKGHIRPPGQRLSDEPKNAQGAARMPLERQRRRDLDAIVLKAIRYEPGERYTSALALASDLSRVMTNRPVAARRSTLRYRAAKFYQRNWRPIWASAAMAAVLATGLIGMAREAKIARQEKGLAQVGVEKERQLAHFLLFNYFERLKQIPGSTNAQRKAVSQSLNYLASVSQTAMNRDLQLDSIQAYTEMGSLLGNPYEENLGDVPGAITTLEKAVSLSQHLLADDPHNWSYLQSAAAAQLALGRVYFGAGNPQRAAEYLVPAADTSRRIVTFPEVGAPDLAQAASVVDALGDIYGQEGAATLSDPAKAVRRYEQAQEIDAASLRKDASCDRCRRGVALEDWKIGILVDDEVRAKDLFNAGLATLSAFSPAEQATARVLRIDTVLRQRLGTTYLHDGHTAEGIRMLASVRQRFLTAIAADPVDVRARFDLVALDFSRSEGFDDLGRYTDEAQADREFLANIETLLRQDPQNMEWQYTRAQGLLRHGRLLVRLGQKPEGRKASQAGLDIVVPLALRSDASGNVLGVAADALTSLHRDPSHDAPLAVAFARRAIASSPHPSTNQIITLAQAQRFAGMQADSHASAQAALALLRAHPRSASNASQSAEALKLLQP
ncbi:MAG: serine/threonine-protein kinase [Bryocella sp.]